jgi:hypothetical protein
MIPLPTANTVNASQLEKAPSDWQEQISLNKFDETILAQIIDQIDLRTLVKTQNLSLPFIHKHILSSSKYASNEESSVSISYIAYHQNYTETEIIDYNKQ